MVGEEPLISVIVPIYNAAPFLDTCIESICKQTYSNLEIILIDDGSTDGSGAICDSWRNKDSRIVVRHSSNGGVSKARNTGIELAKGEFLSFVDADDTVTGEYIDYLLSLLGNTSYKISACNHYVVRNGKSTRNSDVNHALSLGVKEALLKVLYHDTIDVSPWGKLYVKGLLTETTFPEGRIYEDTYAFGELLVKSGGIVYGNKPHYNYIQHEITIVNGKYKDSRHQYIDAAERLSDIALSYDNSDEMKRATLRRRVHARLSVLRYMQENGTDVREVEFKKLRDELRQYVLKNGASVITDRKAPSRDKIAIMALMPGYKTFYGLWDAYSKRR